LIFCAPFFFYLFIETVMVLGSFLSAPIGFKHDADISTIPDWAWAGLLLAFAWGAVCLILEKIVDRMRRSKIHHRRLASPTTIAASETIATISPRSMTA